jgi:metal-sulfur cluster biosynthetic enzyme
MDPEMKRKIDLVLGRVKEPETMMSVLDLNAVQKVSYSATEKKLLVVMDNPESRQKCFCSGMVTASVRRTLMRELAAEFELEFPELAVEVV